MQTHPVRSRAARWVAGIAGAALLGLAAGCPPAQRGTTPTATDKPLGDIGAAALHGANVTDVARPAAHDQPVTLAAARNEWTSFTLAVTLPASDGYFLRVGSPTSDGGASTIPLSSFEPFQVLSMPVDTNRAGYVRHTGQAAAQGALPRALLTQNFDASSGTLNLSALRNPTHPTDPRSRAGGPGAEPALLWFDLHVPKGTSAGAYAASVDLMAANRPQPVASVPVRVTVYDFELPDERHLQMVGRLGWDRLQKLYPEQFEAVTPSWVNRREGRYAATVRTLDHLVSLAQKNRANLVVPALKPIVKWPAGDGPRIDWGDFDSMVRPWFAGDAFADHVGLRYWPLPEAELLDRYDRGSQLRYWTTAASHFAQNQWLGITAASLEQRSPGRPTPLEAAELSTQAGELLRSHGGLRVLAPLEDDQVELATASNPSGVDPAMAARLLTASPALVSAPPRQPWPTGVPRPEHWLRTDLPGLLPYAGAGGDERDVRVWAWLAFLRHVKPPVYEHIFGRNFILWDATLPRTTSPEQPADPADMAWFYPGQWFGTDLPVPTVQLKWLRRAQQDYEYLLLAQDRGEVINALQMARLITKPVEIQPGQSPDPVYALMTGTASQQAWDEAHRLLAETILLRRPGQKVELARQQAVYLRTLQWAAPQERPLLMGRGAQWLWAQPPEGPEAAARREPGTWVDLRFALDIYNASETTPDQNRLRWSTVPMGWQVRPQELEVPRLETYRVLRATLSERFNLDRIGPESRESVELQFVNGFTKVASRLKVVLPVAASDRREGRLGIDGALDDWTAADAIQDGPMVRMFNRPALQQQQMQLASTSSKVYTGWARENFYVAFALDGLAPDTHRAQNFVDYQQRRAWGEDLCELLIQPIYASNKVGPVLHAVCKPNGGVWVERKGPEAGSNPDVWRNLEGAGVRYAATMPENTWRGEVAIPWSTLTGPDGDTPTLLRFNFTQHRAPTGESASWAGPVDYGRDDAFMGLLYLRTPGQPGVNDIVRGER